MRSSGIEIAYNPVVDLHAGRARGEWFASAHAHDHWKGAFLFRGEIHEHATGINQQDFRSHPRERHRGTFTDLNPDPVRRKSHDAGRFYPGNLLKQFLALVERNVKNVAANVAAHDFHHLGASHIREPIHLNVVTRLQTETPRVLSIVIERSCAHGCERGNYDCGDCPKQSSSSLLRKWTAARRDTLLRPQKWRFLLRVQVDQASIIKLF